MTKFLLSTFLLLRSICLLDAQCQSGNCIDGYGIARLGKQSSVAYTGNFQNKKPEGFGKAEYGDGSRYEGYWQNGKWQGKGTFWMASGNILTGVWEDSRYIGADNESVVQTPNDVTPACISTARQATNLAARETDF